MPKESIDDKRREDNTQKKYLQGDFLSQKQVKKAISTRYHPFKRKETARRGK